MKSQATAVRRLWNLENWGLRWKVTAVLAIPVTVAMVLGGIRVQNELSRAVHFSSAADQVVDVPDIVQLGTAFGTASAGYSAATMMPEDLVAVDNAIEKVRAAAENPELSPSVADHLTDLIASIEKIQVEMKAGGPMRPELPAETSVIRAELSQVVDDIVAPIDDPAVDAAHTQLIDAWSSQRRLADQVTGALALLRDPDAPLTDIVSASGAELAMIDTLARSYAGADDKTSALRDGVRQRLDMIDAAAGGPLPLLELRASLLDSVAIYGSLISESSDAISTTVVARAEETRAAALRDAAIVLATLLAALVLALLVSRSLVGPIRRLRYGALQVARQDLPDAIDRVMAGDTKAVDDFEPVPVHTTEEIGQLARAVDDIHGQALRLAGEQASLRLQIGDMFETLARRSKSLVDQQLGLIETLEFEEKDPKRLESLFRLDHLAARMRRNGDNLLILSGNRTRRTQSAPVQLGDVVRAAMSEVEEYQRVQVGSTPYNSVSGAVATDIVHLLAELLDNSLRASPPDTRVRIAFARAVDGGVLLEITDQGIGIPETDLAEINERLASGGQVGPETARHMGLFVVSRLAARHGLTVRLRRTQGVDVDQGITGSVHLPASLLMSPIDGEPTGPQRRVDTPALPPVTVVQSGEMPQLVADQTPPVTRPPAARPVATVPPQQNSTVRQDPVPLGGLPQRVPGASGAPRPAPPAAPPSAPVQAPSPQPWSVPAPSPVAAVDQPAPPQTRHRYRSNPVKTASFFQNRPNSLAQQDVTSTGTPIFADMVSDWLTDPTQPGSAPGRDWNSPADEGWAAASRAGSAPVGGRTSSGLPQRTPGDRLVPGGAPGASGPGGPGTSTRPRLRDPEAVRDNLSRHQEGIREGRAAGRAERNSYGGVR
ncbi:ATP-binding protein [Rhodococcus sp. NPDC003318]|uniref:ATP-binding protein n=1 Tax=Rhodococcus sp. NPDC003318 TaxID=3364503 RepID=UPI0036ACAA35